MHVKLAGIVYGFILLGVNTLMTPKVTSITIVIALVVLDFITGVIKAKINKVARTSEGYRKTLIKIPGYIIVPVVLWLGGEYAKAHAPMKLGEDAGTMLQLSVILKSCSGWVMLFIMYIEIKSIFENLYEMDIKSPFNRYFIKPILAILSFGIENNPLNKAADKINGERKESEKPKTDN